MDSLQWQEQYKFTANDVEASGANLGLSACQIQRRYFFQDYSQVNLTHEHCADIMSNFSSGSNRYDHAVSLSLIWYPFRGLGKKGTCWGRRWGRIGEDWPDGLGL
jgi:hypothetical protein